MKKASRAYYSIINPNSFLFTLIIIFILVFGAASIVAYKHYKSARLYAIAENKSTADLLSSLVYEHQKAATSILESYAQRPLFIDAIQKKDFHYVLYHLKSLNEHHTEMDALFISDQYGTVWANYPVSKESYGKNLAYRDWYKGVSKKWRPYISTVFRLIVLEKGLAVAVSVPVFDRKGNTIGILGSTQRTLFLATFIRANRLNPRKSITLLDQEGNIIYGDTVDYEKEITKYLHFSPIQEAIRNGKNILEIPDPVRGRKEDLLAFSPIKDMEWTVIVSEEKGAILRSETTYFIEIFAMAFLLFVCMTITPLLLRRDYQYRETKELLMQEKELKESEVKYHNLVESISDVIYTIDSSGVLTYISPVVKNTLGYEPDELIGRQFLEFVHKEDHDLLMRRFSELSEGIVGYSDYRVIGKQGDIKWVRTLTNPIIEEGGFVGARGVLIDITERKKAEEALRESEEIFSQFMNYSPIYVFFKDENIKTIQLSKNYTEMLGRPISELLGKNMDDLFPSDLAKSMVADDRRILKEGKKVEIEEELNGRFYSTIKFPIYREGKPAYLAGFTVDITERKKAEETLRGSKEFVENLIASMQDGFSVLDSDGVQIDVNAAFCQMTGFSREELIGVGPPHPYWPPEAYEEIEKGFQKTLRGEFSDIELTFMRKNGERFPVIVSPSWVKDKQGNVIQICR